MRGPRPAACLTALALALSWSATPAGAADFAQGIGVLGDSYSDEYQFYPPDRATARNWVELLATTRGLNFGEFSAECRGEPRCQGYAYNWARSDATTSDVIRTGQHTGLAAQAARGEVRVALVFIGGNDFINAFKSPEPLAALERTLPVTLANYRTIVETLRAAHPELEIFVGTTPDIRNLPEFDRPIRSGEIPAGVVRAFTAAIDRFNAQIRGLPSKMDRVTLLDLEMTSRIANLVSRDTITIAGRRLDRLTPSNDPDHFFLADFRHPGTLAQSLMAQMMIEALNKRFDAGIRPLSVREIVGAASPSTFAAAGRPDAGLAGRQAQSP